MLPHLRKKIGERKNKFAGGKPFNPLTFDVANLLALYDGDLGLDAVKWSDQSANAYDLTLFNAPTVISPAINGHDAIQFDGINQYGQSLLPNFTNPCSIYIVANQLVYAVNLTFLDDTAIGGAYIIDQFLNTPEIRLVTPVNSTINNQMAVGAYNILTAISGAAVAELRINNNAAIAGLSAVGNRVGWNIACRQAINNFINAEFAYIIIRSGADNTATQNLFINWLKSRFAL